MDQGCLGLDVVSEAGVILVGGRLTFGFGGGGGLQPPVTRDGGEVGVGGRRFGSNIYCTL